MKVEKYGKTKTFLLKKFRHTSSAVKIYCSNAHLKIFLMFYKYVTIKLTLYKYIGEQLNLKKT